MPANSSGWFFHCLARETGRIGHLYSPGAERGPWPWFPFALDNGAFSCWDRQKNHFNDKKWNAMLPKWKRLLSWAEPHREHVRWSIVPDIPGDSQRTLKRYGEFVKLIHQLGYPIAIAVQDGMTVADVRRLRPQPDVIAVGGTDEFKWSSVADWTSNFSRVHVLRCNSPEKLDLLESLGVESCDGTGWNRGDKIQTAGLERWARKHPVATDCNLTPFVCNDIRRVTRSDRRLLADRKSGQSFLFD
jgi:hypothetical protein